MKKIYVHMAILLTIFVSVNLSAAVTYVHTDHLGSVVAESNASGQITKRFHYKPFGETIETQQDDIGYTGHKHDADLGLTYMQARYYDPVLGRFYGNDPVGYLGQNPVMSFNRYLYVNNNPYKYTDPTGMTCVTNQEQIACRVDEAGSAKKKEVEQTEKAYTKAVERLLANPERTATISVGGKKFTAKAGDMAEILINTKVIMGDGSSKERAHTVGGTLSGRKTDSGGVEMTIQRSALSQPILKAEAPRNDDALSRTFIHESFHANHTDSAMQELWNQMGAEDFNQLHKTGYNKAAAELFKK